MNHPPTRSRADTDSSDCCTPRPSEPTPGAPVSHTPGRAPVLRIATMDCATEEREIRNVLDGIPDIRALNFNLSARTLSIDAPTDSIALAIAAIRRAGFDPEPVTAPGPDSSRSALYTSAFWRPGIALLLALAAEAGAWFAPDTALFKAAGMLVAALAIGFAGVSTYKKGFTALRQRRLNMNTLMAVAVTGAFLIGQWPEAAMVMALYAIAELIEARAVDRARNAIQSLLALAPDTTEMRMPNLTWETVPASAVSPDAVIRVKPGARIALDGVVVSGTSSVNQAPVTGESLPTDKQTGDPVFAGTINETATLEIKVTATASNSTIARIIHAVEQAQAARAPTQQFVDRFAAVYTPAIFVLAVAVAALGPWLNEWTWMQAIYKALVLLVIACPCALVIATPVTVVSGLAAAARRGILIKGGVYLEQARKLRMVALDKTGTITEGKPRLVDVEIVARTATEDQIKRWTADLAAHSDHPVSKAIADGLGLGGGEVKAFTALSGRGIQAQTDGLTLILGNHRLIEERGLCSAAIENSLATHEAQGRTVTMLASEHEVLAIYAVADTIKPGSRAALSELHALGVSSIMLSGDNTTTAKTIASQAGIDDARGDLLPEDKLAAIEELRSRHPLTAMVGDGINDAPALARADIGIAMGAAGTDTAMEAADIVIMNDDLRRIPEVIRLSRRTNMILRQNILLALGIKGAFLGLAVFASATMWMAVFADMGASLIVVGNGLRLLQTGKHDKQQ